MWRVRKAEPRIDPWLGQLVTNDTINLDKEQRRGKKRSGGER